MNVKELFVPVAVGVNGSVTLGQARTATIPGVSASMGGFLAKISGTISVTSGGATVVDAVPVTAGVYTPIPITDSPVLVVTLAGGAAGTLFA